jgi:hypothetical protein
MTTAPVVPCENNFQTNRSFYLKVVVTKMCVLSSTYSEYHGTRVHVYVLEYQFGTMEYTCTNGGVSKKFLQFLLVPLVRDNKHGMAILVFRIRRHTNNFPQFKSCVVSPCLLIHLESLEEWRFWNTQHPTHWYQIGMAILVAVLLFFVENRGVYHQPRAHKVCAQLDGRCCSLFTETAF